MSHFLKSSQNLSQEVDRLIGQLVGSPVSVPDKPQSTTSLTTENEKYQIPIRVGKGGVVLDEKTKPWIIGTFIPKGYINPKHTHGHPAVDYAAPKGTPIYPIASGKVIEVREYPKGGRTCKVAHEDGHVVSYYAHMDQVKAQVNELVHPNSVIGLVGNTGSAFDTSPHVHLEVKVDGSHRDPQSIMGKPVGSLVNKKLAQDFEHLLNKYAQPTSNSPTIIKIIDQYLSHNSVPVTGQEVFQLFSHCSGEQLGQIVKKLTQEHSRQSLTKTAAIQWLHTNHSSD